MNKQMQLSQSDVNFILLCESRMRRGDLCASEIAHLVVHYGSESISSLCPSFFDMVDNAMLGFWDEL